MNDATTPYQATPGCSSKSIKTSVTADNVKLAKAVTILLVERSPLGREVGGSTPSTPTDM